jgi:putative colanic acid biosynthesis acetyltransferase WcaF
LASNDLLSDKKGFVGPTFSLSNRLRRVAWQWGWLLLARWTPPPFHRWRIAVLRACGAQVDWSAYVYPNVTVWAPWNLKMGQHATLGPNVTVYNIAQVTIDAKAVVSQQAHLCTGTHDHRDPAFPLYARPIHIGRRAWICASAFVGPGVTVGEGAVLAACGVAFQALTPWTVYRGNPASVHAQRPEIHD